MRYTHDTDIDINCVLTYHCVFVSKLNSRTRNTKHTNWWRHILFHAKTIYNKLPTHNIFQCLYK